MMKPGRLISFGSRGKVAALGRMVGQQALEIEFLKGALEKRTAAEKRGYVRHHRPRGLSIAEGCRLMGLSRSIYYDVPSVPAGRRAGRDHDRDLR